MISLTLTDDLENQIRTVENPEFYLKISKEIHPGRVKNSGKDPKDIKHDDNTHIKKKR